MSSRSNPAKIPEAEITVEVEKIEKNDHHHDHDQKPIVNNPIVVGSTATSRSTADDQAQLSNTPLKKCLDACFRVIRNRIPCFHSKGIDGHDSPTETNEEAEAYKKLIDDLEDDQHKNYRKVLIHFLVEVFIVVFCIVLLASTASIHEVQTKSVLNLRPHRWAVLFMVVVSGLPFIRTITELILELLSSFSSYWRRKMYNMFHVGRLRMSFDVTLWFALILWVWYAWFSDEIIHDTRGAETLDVPVSKYTHVLKIVAKEITRLLLALTLGAFFLTLKRLLFSYLEAELHYKQFCPRIRRTILDLYGIQFITHKDKEKWSFLERKNGNSRSRNSEGKDKANGRKEEMSFWMAVSHLNKETVPVRILKRLTKMYKKNMKKPQASDVLLALKTTQDDDKKFMYKAKEMYKKVVRESKKGYIDREDLKQFALRENEVEYVFILFNNENGKASEQHITEDQFLRWAVTAFNNCLGLESTIASSELIFMKLNLLMSSAVVVLTLVIWLLLSELVTTGQIAILFTPFVSASVIFGESIRRTFNSAIFVFAMHPFDVGDRVLVEKVKMKVKDIRLLTTVFFQYETGDEVLYPNYDLATKSIVNLEFEKSVSESVEFYVPINTPEDLVSNLQVTIKKTLDDKLDFTSDTIVAKKDISNEDKVLIIVTFQYLIDYHSAEIRTLKRSEVIGTIMRLCEELEKAKGIEMAVKCKKEEYDTDIVKFQIDTKLKLVDIQALKKKIMDILQKHKSFKDCSKVIFSAINKKKATIDVHMRYRKDDLSKIGDDKQKIRKEIEGEIKAGHGELITEKEHSTL